MILNKKDIDPLFTDEDFYATWPAVKRILEKLPKALPNRMWVKFLVKQMIKVGDFVYNKGEKE